MNPRAHRETMFPARLSAVAAVRGFVESFCTETGVERRAGLRLNLVVEELFTNTVNHGHRGDCDVPVWIRLDAESARVRVTYMDQAPAFNPLAYLEQSPAVTDGSSPDVEQHKVGGLGVLIATRLTTGGEYAYVFGRNRLSMVIAG